MDIKNLSADEIKAARERLASRKSFFGGFVSTRSDAADPNFKPRPQPEPKAKPLQRSHAKPGSAKQQARKPAAKRARDTSDDFASLEDYDSQPAKASKPNGISKVCKQADGAPKAGDVWGQYLAAKLRKEAQQAFAARSRHGDANRPTASAAKAGFCHPDRKGAEAANKQTAASAMRAAAARSGAGGVPRAPSAARPGAGVKQAAGYAELEDLEDFIDDDLAGEDWRSELQSVTGYDPTKFAPVRDDRRMVASKVDIEREERLSKRIGRAEDEKAEEEERRLRTAKEAKREKHRSKSRKGGNGLVLLD